jgi:hypothetical protein
LVVVVVVELLGAVVVAGLLVVVVVEVELLLGGVVVVLLFGAADESVVLGAADESSLQPASMPTRASEQTPASKRLRVILSFPSNGGWISESNTVSPSLSPQWSSWTGFNRGLLSAFSGVKSL